MGRQSIAKWCRELIASAAFFVFLWAIGMTEDQYLTEVEESLSIPSGRAGAE